jgi:hypothetical protein
MAASTPGIGRPLRVVFCLPGRSFSSKFLRSWTNLVGYCGENHIGFALTQSDISIPNLFYVRNLCLGGSVERGESQKPFNGEVDYTHLMWIDSDIIFTPAQFQHLIDRDCDIISGLYMLEGVGEFAAVREWDKEYFRTHGSFQFMKPQEISGQANPIEVAYAGMGFMLVKRGVFEALTYPWFRPIEQRIGNMVDVSPEDSSFCLRVREKGFKIFVDPAVIVGHEKKVILGPARLS